MFNLFKKNKSHKLTYLVFLTENAKYLNLVNAVLESKNLSKTILIYHFQETEVELGKLLAAAGAEYQLNTRDSPSMLTLFNSNKFLKLNQDLVGETIFFAELHPDSSIEQKLLTKIPLESKERIISCYTEIENPFFELLGHNSLQI